jgi:hypothetical protein
MSERLQFSGGINLALKLPREKYVETIAFYRDTLGFRVLDETTPHPTVSQSCRLQFGPMILWLDCVDNYPQPQVWLELNTNNLPGATQYLDQQGVATQDELEKIPEGMHWIKDPSGTVMLLREAVLEKGDEEPLDEMEAAAP